MNEIYLNWEDVNSTWEDTNMPWNEVVEIIELIRKTGGSSAYIQGNPWDVSKKHFGEEKTKKFIKLFCKINELEYEKVLEAKDVKITISQLEKVLNESKVEVKINFKNNI